MPDSDSNSGFLLYIQACSPLDIQLKSVDVDFPNQIRYFSNQAANQMFSRSGLDPFLDLIHFKIVELPGIEPVTSWLLARHIDHSANEAVKVSCI